MLSVFAEFDNNTRTQRTKDGMLERLKQGFWPWRPPIGYYRPTKGSNVAPEPEKAHYIRLAFEEYAKSKPSYSKLAKYLGERGFVTNQGKQPCAQLMEKMLKNPLYYGMMTVWGEHKGSFEPIITEELFYQCQANYKATARF